MLFLTGLLTCGLQRGAPSFPRLGAGRGPWRKLPALIPPGSWGAACWECRRQPPAAPCPAPLPGGEEAALQRDAGAGGGLPAPPSAAAAGAPGASLLMRFWGEEEEEGGTHWAASPADLTPSICADPGLMRCVKRSIYLQRCERTGAGRV